jgi:hypothetical protein
MEVVVATKQKVIDKADACAASVFSLNKPARELFDEATRARVRLEGDNIMVLPSTRTRGIGNLPKTDQMVDLSRSDKGIKFALAVPGAAIGTAYMVEVCNYGWTRFTKVAEGDPIGKDAAIARIVAR